MGRIDPRENNNFTGGLDIFNLNKGHRIAFFCLVGAHKIYHTGHGHLLAMGGEPARVLGELMGKEIGYCRGRGGSQHMSVPGIGFLGTNGITGGGIPIATGAALSMTLQSDGAAPIQLTGSARLRETEFTVTAALDPERLSYAGNVKVRAQSSAGFAELLALAAPRAARRLALDIEFSGDGDAVSVGEVTGLAAGARISAAGDLVFGAPPRASIAVAVDTVSLPWPAGSLFMARTAPSAASLPSAAPFVRRASR